MGDAVGVAVAVGVAGGLVLVRVGLGEGEAVGERVAVAWASKSGPQTNSLTTTSAATRTVKMINVMRIAIRMILEDMSQCSLRFWETPE